MFKYLKSFVANEENKVLYPWTSILILFSDNGKLNVDKGYVIKGILETHEYGYYCQFNNFFYINGKLLYAYPDKLKEIDPEKVYLHILTGLTPFPVPNEHLDSHHLYFPSANNKVYKLLGNKIDKDKIRLFVVKDESYMSSSGSRSKRREESQAQNLIHPLFSRKEIYHPDAVVFSYFDVNAL